MTTTGHITPAVRRYYRAAVADGNRAFAVELVGNAASREPARCACATPSGESPGPSCGLAFGSGT